MRNAAQSARSTLTPTLVSVFISLPTASVLCLFEIPGPLILEPNYLSADEGRLLRSVMGGRRLIQRLEPLLGDCRNEADTAWITGVTLQSGKV